MRFLGIDYGEKRWGLSYGDELGLAVALAPALAATAAERFDAVEQVIQARRVGELVVGYPYNMDGTAGFKAKEVDAFIAELERKFGLPVHRTDERLTSHQAESEARAAGRGRRPRTPAQQRAARATGEIDSRAATLILQDYLDQQQGPPLLPPEEA
jgi:putative Holliday junction resolvase